MSASRPQQYQIGTPGEGSVETPPSAVLSAQVLAAMQEAAQEAAVARSQSAALEHARQQNSAEKAAAESAVAGATEEVAALQALLQESEAQRDSFESEIAVSSSTWDMASQAAQVQQQHIDAANQVIDQLRAQLLKGLEQQTRPSVPDWRPSLVKTERPDDSKTVVRLKQEFQ